MHSHSIFKRFEDDPYLYVSNWYKTEITRTMNIMDKSPNLSPNNIVCTTDFGECMPSQLAEHGTQHDTIGSILSTSVRTHCVIGTASIWVICP